MRVPIAIGSPVVHGAVVKAMAHVEVPEKSLMPAEATTIQALLERGHTRITRGILGNGWPPVHRYMLHRKLIPTVFSFSIIKLATR